MSIVLVNGEHQIACPARDRGLHFGDGLFETMLCVDGRVIELERHWNRLQDGCRRLGIENPVSQDRVATEVRQAEFKRAVAKLIVTRGTSDRGYRSPPSTPANWMLFVGAAPAYPSAARESGVPVKMCKTRVSIEDPTLAGLKHLNRLPQVMARREWNDEYHDGLLMDPQGQLIEGSAHNLFLVIDGAVVTPDLSRSGVVGTMRQRVLEYVHAQRIPCEVRSLDDSDLVAADEVFLTNAIYGIVPVGSIDDRRYPTKTVTNRLVEALCRGTYC